MANLTRHFFRWDRPLLPQLVAWLARDWDRAGPLDLSDTLAVVPTRETGRRLREALAAHAATAGRAAFPPRVSTPDGILVPGEGAAVASPLQTILAWSAVLQAADLEDFRAVFPIDPPERNFAWGLRLGRQFAQLQSALAEAGWRIGDVARLVETDVDFTEADRWEQLTGLERRYDRRLANEGLADVQAAKIQAADAPAVPEGIERMVILATPDPLPLVVQAWARLAERIPVAVAVFAHVDEGPTFDEWGRPLSQEWCRRPAPLDDFTSQVRLEADPDAQAERIAALARAYRGRPGSLALGIADPEVTGPLAAALTRAQLPVFDPQGRPRRQDGFYHLLNSLADFMRGAEFRRVEAVGRCPEILEWLIVRGGNSFSAANWLAGLDELRSRHLPPDLDAARRFAPGLPRYSELTVGLAALADLRGALVEQSFPKGSTAALAMIFGGRRPPAPALSPSRPTTSEASATNPPDEVGFVGNAHSGSEARGQAALVESANSWMNLVRQCRDAATADLSPDEWWDLALRLYGDELSSAEKPVGAFELQGWIELLWEEAPHLVLAGMNDGSVPGAIVGDAFLPESLRIRLGLKTNAARLARDAYILYALAQSRRAGGRLDLLVGKNSADGEPLRPSRLLLLCPDDQLAGRVRHLFRVPSPAGPPLPWTRAWKLAPPVQPIPERVSVTALRGWLECPFRFYLRHVLKMEGVDSAKSEMDQLDFGTLCHAALEAMGRDESLTACTDPAPLREFLLAAVDREARRKFGDLLSLPLLVQLESARQRLSWLAEVQAAEQAKGWRIVAVEKKVTVTIEGLEVVAKVDRIDRHLETGVVRVLDYKTSDAAVNPASAHLRNPSQMRSLPEWAGLEYDGKPAVWSDLQLPLYRHALAAEYPTLAECGYFNLPKASADARLEWWEPYPRDLQESALACAAGVCRAIRAAEFWPPNEEIDPARDPYAALFQRGVAASIDWSPRTAPPHVR